ncbi:MAG: hypothetical protein ACTSSE_10790 [Candidatus Thorarchaeota archaeon]
MGLIPLAPSTLRPREAPIEDQEQESVSDIPSKDFVIPTVTTGRSSTLSSRLTYSPDAPLPRPNKSRAIAKLILENKGACWTSLKKMHFAVFVLENSLDSYEEDDIVKILHNLILASSEKYILNAIPHVKT